MNVCVQSSTHVEGRGQLAEVDSLLPPSGSQGLIPGVRLGGESLHPLSHFTSLKIKLKWHPATSAFFHPVPGSFPSIAAGKVIITETTYPVRPEICTVSPQGKVSQPLLDHMVIHGASSTVWWGTDLSVSPTINTVLHSCPLTT